MKNKLTEWLVKPYVNESVNLPIEIGDTVLMGRFKNKRVKVKTITYNEKGDLQINGRPALKFRIPKSDKKLLPTRKNGKDSVTPDPDMYGVEDENPNKKWKNEGFGGKDELPAKDRKKFERARKDNAEVLGYELTGTKDVKEEFGAPAGVIPSPSAKGRKKWKKKLDKERNFNECIAFSKKFGDDIVLGKNRDRNYTPELKVVREIGGNGIEILYVQDQDTDWSEGMNSNGIGLVNSALFVKRDEKDFDKSKKKKAPSKDGIRIRHALSKDTLKEVVESLVKFDTGVKGHTIVSDGRKLVVIENTSRTKPSVKIHNIEKSPVVRSNHGIVHPEQGYTRGPDRISSEMRMKNAMDIVKKETDYKKLFPKFYNHTQPKGPKFDLVRAQNKLWTSSQVLMNLNKKEVILYLIPGAVKFLGIENKLPNNYKAQLKLNVRQYEHGPSDKYDTFVKTDKQPKKSAIKDTDVVSEKSLPNKISDKYRYLKPNQETDVDRDFLKHHAASLGADKMGRWSEPDTYDWDDEDKEKGGWQKEKDKKKTGYEPVTEANTKVRKIVAIYPGRFQPFGPHHKKVYDALSKNFNEVYITTSAIQQMPRHPLNFNEKKKHMMKMGIPGNRIIQERVPYVANSLLKKFKDDTAVVYAVGRKDRGRFNMGKKKSGGLTYYQDLKKNLWDLKPHTEHGYIYEAPHVKVSGISSGTEIRKLLGSPKMDEKKRQQIFKKTFKYFDKSTYEMMTSKFGKLFEFFQQPKIKNILKEVNAFGHHFDASIMSDEGMYDFFGSLDDYFTISPEHADILDWELIGFPIRDSEDMMFTIMADEYEQDRAKTVTYGKTINQNRKNTESVKDPYPKYKERLNKILSNLNWEVVKFFGEEHVEPKLSDSPLMKKSDVKKGVKHIKKVKEGFQQDVDLLIEAMCGVGQNPADTGCTPKGKSKTKVKTKPYKIPKFKFKAPKFSPEEIRKAKEKARKKKEKALARPDRKPNMKDGVDVMRDKKDDKHFSDDFYYKGDKGHDMDKIFNDMGIQYNEQKKKLSAGAQKLLEIDIKSWKKYGGFEAIQNAIEDGDITEDQVRERNKRMSDLAHKTVNRIDKPIERGIDVTNDVADLILSEFEIGEMVEIPDESGHGSSGFSISNKEARHFARIDADEPEEEAKNKTSIIFRIKPNSKGQVRGLYVDGDEASEIEREGEIIRSSKSKAKVVSVETKKMSNGRTIKIVTLQEPDDLTEMIVKEVNKKYSAISRKYLEGPLNPRPKKKELQKEHLILEGGAFGHLNHPFDDNNLTFSDLKNIIIIGLEGKLNREDKVSEKLDGQNLMVSWVDGRLKAARNKGHLKDFGRNALDAKGVASKFAGRGEIKTAFVGAMVDLERAIGSLSDKQKEKVFGNGSKWMNLEVIYPQTSNVIDYDVAEIVFHGTSEYNQSGSPIGYSKEAARMLEGMIRQVNQNIQKKFKIGKPNFLQVPKSQNFGKLKSRFLGRLNKLQSRFGLSDGDRLSEYHRRHWQELILKNAKSLRGGIQPKYLQLLTRRWAFFDKSYAIRDIKKDFADSPKFLNWVLKTDKQDHRKIFQQTIKPFEILFFEVGAEILKNIQGFLAVSPDKAIEKIRQDVINAMRDLQKPGNVEKLEKLKIQIEKLEAIGGVNAIVPSEGVVFKYKGNLYKFTGAFAPINQILGSLRF